MEDAMEENGDDAVLRAMLVQAERLCRSGDALMAGQYEYLRARIDALLELRCCAAAGTK
jgi:hypothetical protein